MVKLNGVVSKQNVRFYGNGRPIEHDRTAFNSTVGTTWCALPSKFDIDLLFEQEIDTAEP